mgnify:CR=1 FL=1
MKKIYRIIVLIITFVFLTTYTQNKSNIDLKSTNFFFGIKNISILNNDLIEIKIIQEKLKPIYKKNIFFIQRNHIEKLLISTNFLEKIEVRKKYPDTIIIKIYETKPMAIFIEKDQKYLLDSSSNLILFEDMLIKNLPNIFGKNAEKNFVIFFKELQKYSFDVKKVKNFYFFQIGRWDVQLSNGQTIKFPSGERSGAIKKAVELLKRNDFQKYNIIDLRVHGKIVVE